MLSHSKKQTFLKTNDFRQALTDAERCVALDPANAKSHYLCALAHKSLEDLAAARQSLCHVLALAPDHETARLRLAEVELLLHPPSAPQAEFPSPPEAPVEDGGLQRLAQLARVGEKRRISDEVAPESEKKGRTMEREFGGDSSAEQLITGHLPFKSDTSTEILLAKSDTSAEMLMAKADMSAEQLTSESSPRRDGGTENSSSFFSTSPAASESIFDTVHTDANREMTQRLKSALGADLYSPIEFQKEPEAAPGSPAAEVASSDAEDDGSFADGNQVADRLLMDKELTEILRGDREEGVGDERAENEAGSSEDGDAEIAELSKNLEGEDEEASSSSSSSSFSLSSERPADGEDEAEAWVEDGDAEGGYERGDEVEAFADSTTDEDRK